MAKEWMMLAVLILWAATGNAQDVNGRVIDAETKAPLEYVQVGILDQQAGVLTDEQGYFSFPFSLASTDFLIFSFLGYEKKQLAVSQLQVDGPAIVALDKAVYELPGLEVSSGKLDQQQLGYRKSDCKKCLTGWAYVAPDFYTSRNAVGERGTLIPLEQKGREHLLRALDFHIRYNVYDSVLFRIHVYSVKNGAPDQELTRENIFVKTNKRRGWVHADLLPYGISPTDDFIISLEWVRAWGRSCKEGRFLCLVFSAGQAGRSSNFSRELFFSEDWDITTDWYTLFSVEVGIATDSH